MNHEDIFDCPPDLKEMIKLYLEEYGGDYQDFLVNFYECDQRLGQSFFNALSQVDKNLIRGTIKDPFYMGSHYMGQSTIWGAMEWLMKEHEKNSREKQPLI